MTTFGVFNLKGQLCFFVVNSTKTKAVTYLHDPTEDSYGDVYKADIQNQYAKSDASEGINCDIQVSSFFDGKGANFMRTNWLDGLRGDFISAENFYHNLKKLVNEGVNNTEEICNKLAVLLKY